MLQIKLKRPFLFLSLMIITAMLSGLSALLFEKFELWHHKYIPMITNYLHLTSMQANLIHGLLVIIILYLILWLRDNYFKGTDGTGIPQIIAALKYQAANKPYASILSWKILFGKILLLFFAIAVGLTVGREGPSVQVGACIMFLLLAKTLKTSPQINRGIILAGAGAGLAAAFNTPIAAFVFVIEECAKTFEKSNIVLINLIILIACFACILFLHNYYFLGKQPDLSFHDFSIFYFLVPISALSGFLGGCFSQLVCLGSTAMGKYYTKYPNIIRITLGITIVLIGLASHGSSYGSGYDETLIILKHANQIAYPWYYPLTKALSCAVSLISGIPGGLFDPSFSISASLGQWIAHLLHFINITQVKLIILITMASYFSGVVQSPVTAFIIITEMTGTYNLAVPLGIASMIGCYFSERICPKGIYDFLADNFMHILDRDIKK